MDPTLTSTTDIGVTPSPSEFEQDAAGSYVDPWACTVVWAFINCVLFVFIVSGNIMTIIAIRICRQLRRINSNLFVLSLAVSDFFVGIALPFHVTFYLTASMGKHYALCLVRFFLIIFACCVSILTLISIAVDRYIAIVYALQYKRYMTRRVAILLITFNWLVGGMVAAIPIFWNNWSIRNECEFVYVLPNWYVTGVITPGFIIIWVFMIKIYWRIMHEASQHVKQLKQITSSVVAPVSCHADRKSVQVVIIIMGCFSLCWLPYFIIACAQQAMTFYTTTSILYKASFSLAMTNSGLNPVIYTWKNTGFRQAFLRLLHCKSPNGCAADPLAAVHYSVTHKTSEGESADLHGNQGVFLVAIKPIYKMQPDDIKPSIYAMALYKN